MTPIHVSLADGEVSSGGCWHDSRRGRRLVRGTVGDVTRSIGQLMTVRLGWSASFAQSPTAVDAPLAFHAGMGADSSEAGRVSSGEWPASGDEPSAFGNRVDERAAVAIAVAAGAVAGWSGAEPTGSTALDVMLVVVSTTAVVWAAASAPWWALAVVAGVAAVTAMQPVLAAIGVVACVGALVIGARRDHLSAGRGIVAALAINVLLRSELEGFFGLSALIGVSLAAALWVLGVRRRPARLRRRGVAVTGAVVVVALVAVGLGATAALGARTDLELGARLSRQAITTLNTGEYEAAADEFVRASTVLDRAEGRIGGLMGLPARLVPGVAQNMRAASELSAEASRGAAEAASALRSIDPSALRLVEGSIDLEAVAAVEAPLLEVRDALVDLRAVKDDVDSGWLLEPLQTELDRLGRRLDDSEPRLDTAVDAVRLAPTLLGADGERRYLILFTTPAEARGLGGFVGNYAEMTVADGRIDLAEFGHAEQLNRRSSAAEASCEACPADYLAQWGRFGANNGPDGTVGPKVWSNLTMAAHFPDVAESAQILFAQATGRPVDGVVVVDPFVVAALMRYTGPIEVPELGVTVRAGNAASFILYDQYLITQERAERVDALDTLGRGAIEALLTGALPPPARLAKDLGPLVEERRLLMWTGDDAEQELLASTGLLGALPDLGPHGGFSVSVNNTGESKIDVFLERSVDVRLDADAAGRTGVVADVRLTNGAPDSGLPTYVIGNSFGLPEGSSRVLVTFYGPPGLDAVTRNGAPIAVSSAAEAGWMAYGFADVLGPGETVDYHLEFVDVVGTESGAATTKDGDALVEWQQPLAQR